MQAIPFRTLLQVRTNCIGHTVMTLPQPPS